MATTYYAAAYSDSITRIPGVDGPQRTSLVCAFYDTRSFLCAWRYEVRCMDDGDDRALTDEEWSTIEEVA